MASDGFKASFCAQNHFGPFLGGKAFFKAN